MENYGKRETKNLLPDRMEKHPKWCKTIAALLLLVNCVISSAISIVNLNTNVQSGGIIYGSMGTTVDGGIIIYDSTDTTVNGGIIVNDGTTTGGEYNRHHVCNGYYWYHWHYGYYRHYEYYWYYGYYRHYGYYWHYGYNRAACSRTYIQQLDDNKRTLRSR